VEPTKEGGEMRSPRVKHHRSRMTLTQKRLKKLLHYNRLDGIFTWRVSRGPRKAGDIAGGDNDLGYIRICVYGVDYLAHRLAWFYMKGIWPEAEIDHKDTDPSNNRWENLRNGSRSFNLQNRRRANINSSTGLLGASPNGKGFRSRIMVDGKYLSLGTYPTPKLAYIEYLKAKRELHLGCTI
jgi:hypothetical protein